MSVVGRFEAEGESELLDASGEACAGAGMSWAEGACWGADKGCPAGFHMAGVGGCIADGMP